MVTFGDRLKHAWNAFANDGDPIHKREQSGAYGSYFSSRPHRMAPAFTNERSIISSIYTRLSIDVSAIDIRHVRLDEERRYLGDIDSGLNECLTVEANLDQAARAFVQDIALTLFERGVVAIVPVDTTLNPLLSGGFDIKTMRVGWITQWFPDRVRVNVYNEETALREEITVPKKICAIVENPLYTVMNEPSSTLQRLRAKLSLLDQVDNASAANKLDIVIQLPYTIKTESKRQQAEQRRVDLEFQLKNSAHGIGYIDSTERITQLNRPVDNQLLEQVKYLTDLLYVELGLTPEVMNGTAKEDVMLNYFYRTIEPLLESIVQAMRRTFLTKTARSQKQWILYFRDPFKLVPMGGENGIADIADKLARNEIATSNEIRQVIGWKPSADPMADQLNNSNMPGGPGGLPSAPVIGDGSDPAVDGLNSNLDDIESQLNTALGAN